MHREDFCESCDQKHDCKEVYQQLGKKEGLSVTFKVVIAFLIPILVFISSLVIFEHILAKAIDSKELRIAVDFLSALSITFVCILIIKVINKSGDRSQETE